MNDEIKSKLITYLNSLEKATVNAVDFGKQEIPLYIQEIIKWEIISNLMRGIFSLIGAILCFVIFYLFAKHSSEENDDACIPGAIFSFIIGALLLFITLNNFERGAKAYYAPRIVIVEKLKGLTK